MCHDRKESGVLVALRRLRSHLFHAKKFGNIRVLAQPLDRLSLPLGPFLVYSNARRSVISNLNGCKIIECRLIGPIISRNTVSIKRVKSPFLGPSQSLRFSQNIKDEYELEKY